MTTRARLMPTCGGVMPSRGGVMTTPALPTDARRATALRRAPAPAAPRGGTR